MSTSVDQRGKGQPNQVSNGTIKDGVKEEEFDPYLQQQQQPPIQGYGPGAMSSPITDPFMPNYYNQPMSFPYLGQGLGDGAWSNGGDTSAMFSAVGGYDYNGMFSGFGYPQFWADYQPSEYWGQSATAPQGQARKDARGYAAEDYYRATDNMIPADPYAAMNGDVERDPAMNSVEQGLKGMNISMENQMDGSSGEMSHPAMDPSVQQGSVQNSGSSQAPKKTSWAAIASQPARPQIQKPRSIPRAPMNPARQQNLDIGTWDSNKNSAGGRQGPPQPARSWSAPRSSRTVTTSYNGSGGSGGASNPPPSNSGNAGLSTISAPSNGGNGVSNHPVLEKLKSANQYNPKDFTVNTKGARYFIIKSYSEDDIHRSIKYSIWCSTEHGNKRLDAAFKEREGKGPIYLLFSVNGSGHFCGMAEMKTGVDYQRSAGVWAQDKWKGQIEVKWIYVKDVPNSQLRHIRLENNENKPVTNSRDTQEVPPEKGKQVLKIIHNYKHTTSIFDDFGHYEKRQEEDVSVTKRTQSDDYGRDRQGSSKGRGGRQN